jgi:AcrR family transcriptional regulator
VGVLHYYFSDKVDLITHCVKRYKAQCVLRNDQIVATAGTAEALADGFAEGLAATAREDAPLHRLWSDLAGSATALTALTSDVRHLLPQLVER